MKRKEILPKWIRFFSWIFLIFFIAPLVFLIGLIGGTVDVTVFGLEYSGNTSLHPIPAWGLLLMTLAAFVAYGILWEKDWALKAGILYGWLALGTCAFAVVLRFLNDNIYIPLEPVLLIPFLVILMKRRSAWEAYHEDAFTGDQVEPGAVGNEDHYGAK